ncbi:copper resistance protein CopC [Saccharothrix sp. 6-C]|uniref:copper resistance CopC family protein n=1 Tax=Saccharothrix sp. 6-C TaxID=2781735 RepID=UPI0019175276|nr:copper resistance CopC family protein [Saccharothrix sp. 6-C]QQQ78477.1 copper resistance protein CopC [Saccharothrix sp. 6-C]
MTRLALSALLALLVLFGVSPQAQAHTELVSSDPASGASLPQRPTLLKLTFTEPVPAESAQITVLAADGSAWPTGEVTADGATLTVPLPESGSPAGQHTVRWTVESLDGDFVDGTFAFTVTAPPAAQQPPAATTPAAPPAVTSGDAAPTTSPAAATGSVATLDAPATPTSSPVATPAGGDEGGVPLWVWIAVAAVVAVIGVAVGVGLSRRAKRGAEPAE